MDTAFVLYQKADRIINETGEGKELLGKLYNNISQVYNEHYHNYPKALEFLFSAVDLNTKKNSYNSLSFNYGNISDVYMQMEDYPKAKLYAYRMLEVSEKLNGPHRLVNAYLQLSHVARQMKEYDSALYYNERQFKIADSLSNVKKTGQIADMQTKYETQKKEVQITELSKVNTFKSRSLAGAIIAIAVLASLLFIVVRQRK
jgi:tetratricopeptide (TPR) repeat protein